MKLSDILQTQIHFFQNIGPDYLHRYRLLPMIEYRGRRWYPPRNVFLHRFLQSDRGRDPHDHPWESWSILLAGELQESYWRGGKRKGIRLRHIRKFRVIHRPATWCHRLIVPEGKKAWTLFVVGPKVREWGFLVGIQRKWVHWKEYLGVD